MISMRIKMFALNSMEKKCMNISHSGNQLLPFRINGNIITFGKAKFITVNL